MPGGLNPPPSVIASWPIPNYVDPPQRGPGVLIVTIVFTILMLAATSARMWVRFFKTRSPGLDDYLILMAMVSFHLSCSLLAYSIVLTDQSAASSYWPHGLSLCP